MFYVMNILNDLEKIETSLMGIYAKMAEHFVDDDDCRALFLALSRDEETHAGHVRYQKRLVRQSPTDFCHVSIDLDEMKEILEFLGHLLENPPTPSPEEAVRLAIDLESTSQEKMYRSIIVESCPELKPLIDNLTRFDEKHLSRLQAFMNEHFPEDTVE